MTIPTSAERIHNPIAISGTDIDSDEPVILQDKFDQTWRLAAVEADNALFELQQNHEVPYKPHTRTIPTKELQIICGWVKPSFNDDFDIELDDADMMADITSNQHNYVRDLGDGARVRLVEACDAAFSIAEPLWLYANDTERRDAFEFELFSCLG